MQTQAAVPNPEDGPGNLGRDLLVTVHDEDAGGQPVKIEAHPSDTVDSVIKTMYTKLKTQRQPGDRLRCEEGGGDVFQYAAEHLEAYANQHCSKLVWLFTAKTGGA